MAITTCLPTQFKLDLLNGVHNFGTHTFKMALFTSSAALDAATTAYSTTNEVTNTAGSAYTAGGVTMSGVATATSGTTAYVDWTTDPSWTSASFTARGCMIYNTSASNKAVYIGDFGADQPVSAGTFTVVLPAAGASTAVIRIAG